MLAAGCADLPRRWPRRLLPFVAAGRAWVLDESDILHATGPYSTDGRVWHGPDHRPAIAGGTFRLQETLAPSDEGGAPLTLDVGAPCSSLLSRA